jgi:hypothetical protein
MQMSSHLTTTLSLCNTARSIACIGHRQQLLTSALADRGADAIREATSCNCAS